MLATMVHSLSCFPHVVNLTCKAVLKEITDMKFVAANAHDYVPSGPAPINFLDVLNCNPIATVRTLVCVVSVVVLLFCFHANTL